MMDKYFRYREHKTILELKLEVEPQRFLQWPTSLH